LDEALEVLSPILTGALILGLLSALWLAFKTQLGIGSGSGP
jgi:hypothetical protein